MSITIIDHQPVYDFKHDRVNQLSERLLNINWYHRVGMIDNRAKEKVEMFMDAFHISNYDVSWLEKEDINNCYEMISLQNSDLWEVLKVLPDQLKDKIDESGKGKLLEEIVYHLPEMVYHEVFKQAFQTFAKQETVRFFIGHSLYISLFACTWELISDLKGWEENPFAYLVDVLEMGHVPIGPNGQTFYLL